MVSVRPVFASSRPAVQYRTEPGAALGTADGKRRFATSASRGSHAEPVSRRASKSVHGNALTHLRGLLWLTTTTMTRRDIGPQRTRRNTLPHGDSC